jgi:hypothetical protein
MTESASLVQDKDDKKAKLLGSTLNLDMRPKVKSLEGINGIVPSFAIVGFLKVNRVDPRTTKASVSVSNDTNVPAKMAENRTSGCKCMSVT